VNNNEKMQRGQGGHNFHLTFTFPSSSLGALHFFFVRVCLCAAIKNEIQLAFSLIPFHAPRFTVQYPCKKVKTK